MISRYCALPSGVRLAKPVGQPGLDALERVAVARRALEDVLLEAAAAQRAVFAKRIRWL